MATQELVAALEDTKKKLDPNNPEAATEFVTKVNTIVNKFAEIMHQYKPYSIGNAYTDFVTDYYDLLCTVKDYFIDTSIETVLELVDDTTCKILRVETEKDREQQAKCKDPRVSADNIPISTTMINRLASLPNFKSITSEHKETIIKLFLSLQQAHNAAAKTAAYLASLAHVLNTDQFSYLLKHSMRPLVQL